MDEYICADPVRFDHHNLFRVLQGQTLEYRLVDPYCSLVSSTFASEPWQGIVSLCSIFNLMPCSLMKTSPEEILMSEASQAFPVQELPLRTFPSLPAHSHFPIPIHSIDPYHGILWYPFPQSYSHNSYKIFINIVICIQHHHMSIP